MTAPAIRVEALTRRFGSTTAVDDVTTTVDVGQIYGFLGRNGAGKTTLIRLLLGHLLPTAGRVELFGTAVRGGRTPPGLWAGVGHLVEGPGLYPQLTVADHLHLARRYRQLAPGAVDAVVQRLDLGRYLGVRARVLSLGNRQRLGLALALVHRPPLLVLDEPVNGLDPAGVVDVRTLLRELADDGVTVFMSSHLISEVTRLADRVGIIHGGRLVDELDGERLGAAGAARLVVRFRTPALAASAVGVLTATGLTVEPGGDDRSLSSTSPAATAAPDEVAVRLVQAGVPPTALAVEHEDLERVFLRLTEAAA